MYGSIKERTLLVQIKKWISKKTNFIFTQKKKLRIIQKIQNETIHKRNIQI